MKTKTLSQLRDADFADSLKASLKRYHDRNERPTSTQIINDALAMRPRRYYLSYRTVENTINHISNEPSRRQARHTASRQQWDELSRAVFRYLARHKDATTAEAVNHVINFERPSRFFISERKARELLRRTLRRKYCFIS